MSRIIRSLDCDKCGKRYSDVNISLGHPAKDIKFRWKCECGHENIVEVKAWPAGWNDPGKSGESEIKNTEKENKENNDGKNA